MARSGKGIKLLASLVLILVLLVTSAGVIFYLLTRPVEIEFAQDPNPLEAHEANRKLKLLDEARESNRLGFVRLSEVEINSFLDQSFNDPKKKKAQTNDVPVEIVKTSVLLHHTNLTFITWINATALGFSVPFVWQRTVTPAREDNRWTFKVTSMQLGRLNIPEPAWKEINSFLGRADTLFNERRTWLADIPKIALVKNELSLRPEVRLYSYRPEKTGL